MKKNLSLFTLVVFAVVSLLFATASMAQTDTTGTVVGVVADQNGAVVPNATVTISGPNLISPRTTTSDSNGAYRFSQVPPGRYTVETAALSGFKASKRENVEVNLGSSTSVDVTLTTSIGVTVDVPATAEIDPTNNTTGSNISTEFFSNIPTSRTVQGLYTIAPTVARSGLRDASGRDRDPSVAGSSGPENSYILDGVTTTDPAFGGSGANLPFEFVQEVQIKTGSYGADQGLSTGGVFNVVTKSGGNEFHGDVFAFIGNKSLIRATKNFPLVGLAPNGFSEIDAGFDIGGPIVKNKLTFFAAFNPQYRTNNFLTQSFHAPVSGKINTPFYSAKLSWLLNSNNTLTVSTFADFTTQKGHLFAGSGFGEKPASFLGTQETGGTNYSARLNSNIKTNFIGEFSFGLHNQRNNVIPDSSVASTALITDNFAVLRSNGTVVPVTQTGVLASGATSCVILAPPNPAPPSTCNIGFVDFVFNPGGSLQRNFVRDGFGLFQNQKRNRWETAARMQYIAGRSTFKFGFEFYENKYDINQTSTGPSGVFANPFGVGINNGTDLDNRTVSGYRVTNAFTVCTTRTIAGVGTVVCPSVSAQAAFNALPIANRPAGFTANAVCTVVAGSSCVGPVADLTAAEALNNPFLLRASTSVRDFKLIAKTHTRVESFYFQHDFRVTNNLQINMGARWDFQQANGNEGAYLKLNNPWDNLQPRFGVIWDPKGNGKTKVFVNYALYLETPIPLDANVRAGSNNTQTDKNFRVNRLNAPLTATIANGFNTRNLGAESTPIDAGLKPQTVHEFTVGFETEVSQGMTLGARYIYRPQGSVIEDGSFDDGDHYFLFNPGEIRPGQNTTEEKACNDPAIGCFGRARRYFRGVEFTFNKRLSNGFNFAGSYVFSSLIGNYEGLFRNDNGQSDPNITSLFDLVSLLKNLYGRLPNDRPHQLKFNGSYTTPFKLVLSSNFYAQSGIPFNQLIPHFLYGNNEGFQVQRGTAIIPNLGANSAGVESAVGKNRSPLTWNLDVGAYYPIKTSETTQLRFTVDWFNVTNAQRAVTVDQTFSINSGVAGVAPVLNPFWGSGTIFQYPSALRLGAKFSF